MNDELDQELWDLLKENPEEETQKPEKKEKKEKVEKPASSEKGPVVTERRKKALVLYLVGLFGIAFVVVLISLLMRGRPGGTPQVDNTQLQALQSQIQTLENKKEALESEKAALALEKEELHGQIQELKGMQEENELKIYELNCLLVELTEGAEYVESGNVDANARIELLLQKLAAYENLVKAQNNFIDFNEEELQAAMAALEGQLGHLSTEAVNAYYMVMEYMEQPYLGN